MILSLTWPNPTPHPSCGYKALYRRKGESSYTTILTSGSTSGTTAVTTYPTAPASYEGTIQSDCCSDNLSDGTGWGTNAYSVVSVTVSISGTDYLANISSSYANPYATIIEGTYVSTLHGTMTFTVTYPADSTSATVVIGTGANQNAESVSNTIITDIQASFANGGELQQYDPIRTPPYFMFAATSGQTSGTTLWAGSPTTLPSFTSDAFNVTEVDLSDNPTAGNLLVSWIQGYEYGAAASPYDYITLKIEETLIPGTVLGEATVATDGNGLKNMTIDMVKGGYPIATSTSYTMKAYWNDGTLITNSSKVFYLPDF